MPNYNGPSRTFRVSRSFTISVVLCLALTSAVQPSAIAGTTEHNRGNTSARWVANPPLGQARAGLGAAKVNGTVYAVGGRAVDDSQYDNVEARKLSGAGLWADVAPLPAARGNLAVAAVGGSVYAIGGVLDPYVSTGRITSQVDRFDPGTGLWEAVEPLPQPRVVAGAASLNGLLYVAGGVVELAEGNEQITDSVLAYDRTTNHWRSVAAMTSPREGLRLVAAGQYLYAIGGGGLGFESLATAERYDPIADKWTAIAAMNESRWLPCAVETKVGNRHLIAVVAGGEFLPGGELVDGRRTTEVLDLETGRWALLDVLLPFVRASQDCVTKHNGNILAIGGSTHDSGTFTYLANVDELALKPSDIP